MGNGVLNKVLDPLSKALKIVPRSLKAHYTELDIANGKITILAALGSMRDIFIVNNSATNTLTITINSIPVVLQPSGDSRGQDSWSGTYDPFTEITVTGTSPDFDAWVSG